MWWRALFLILSLALPAAQGVRAQVSTIPVRGGEHDAYTRLVIQIPEDNTWRVITEGSFAQLVLSGPPVIFDLSQTFARIPRSRLRDLRTIEAGLELSLACTCDIRASEDIPQFLVIDITGQAAGMGLAPATAPRPPERGRAQRPDAVMRGAEARRAGQGLARSLRDPQITSDELGWLTLAQLFPVPVREVSPPILRQGQDPDGPTARGAMIEVLAQSLARHVSSGILESTPAFPARDDTRDTQTDLTPPTAAMAHFEISDARHDRETSAALDTICPDPALLEFALPQTSADMPAMAQLLRRLHTEFDDIDSAAVIALAQRFLTMGFGAEARLVLSMLDTPHAATAVLRQISFVTDLSPPEDPGLLAALAECNSMGALWAFLAQPEQDVPSEAQLDLLVQAVGALPAHLRLHLGPQIIKRLVTHQLLEHARIIRDALERVAQTPTPDLDLARTRLELVTAPVERTARIEAGLSPEQSDEALIFLLERRLADPAPVEAELIALAQTRLPALRRSRAGQELARLLVLALAQNGNFAAAFDLLAGRDTDLEPTLRDRLRATVFSRLVEDAEDPEFVTLVFDQTPWDDLTLPQPTRHALEQRLRGLGFEQQATLMAANFHDIPVDHATTVTGNPSRGPVPASTTARTPDADTRTRENDDLMQRIDGEDPEADVIVARAAVEALRVDGEQQRNAAEPPGPSLAPRLPPDTRDDPLGAPEVLPEARALRDAATLAQSRTALDESAALRARLEAMLAGEDAE